MWIPEIMHSPAYKDGLIIITFDEGSTSTACCGETPGKSASHPNAAEPGMSGPGGGASARCCCRRSSSRGRSAPSTTTTTRCCARIEDIFGLSHLGDAAMPQVKPFGSDVFTNS